MLTFLAALRHYVVNSPSLKLSVSVIFDDREIVGADSRRANVGDMKKMNNGMNPPKDTMSMLTFFAAFHTIDSNFPLLK